MKIGICGGTFDPFHRGHLEPVLAARDAMRWDRILYMPAHRQPFKSGQESASGPHRFAMAVLATEERDDVWVSSWELERPAVSYTVDTLELLRSVHPDATLDWIIGDDNLARLGEWKSLGRIFELANFVVLTRGGGAPDPDTAARTVGAAERGISGGVVFVRNDAVPVSATEVRRRIRDGESIDALVDPRVSRYIEHNRLYRPVTKGNT